MNKNKSRINQEVMEKENIKKIYLVSNKSDEVIISINSKYKDRKDVFERANTRLLLELESRNLIDGSEAFSIFIDSEQGIVDTNLSYLLFTEEDEQKGFELIKNLEV